MENDKTVAENRMRDEPDAAAERQAPPGAEEALAAAEQQAEAHWNRYLRAAAELENLRKRAERDLEHAHKFALERFALELLPVKDSLEMGLAAVPEANTDEAVTKLREGKEMTLKLLAQVFERFGIAKIDPRRGERFDPDVHEAMAMQESAECEPNTVLTAIQKGYLLNGRLLRPARVMVAKEPGQ
jgi:molecular chaperone GrpE